MNKLYMYIILWGCDQNHTNRPKSAVSKSNSAKMHPDIERNTRYTVRVNGSGEI